MTTKRAILYAAVACLVLAIGCGRLGMRMVMATPKKYQFDEKSLAWIKEHAPNLDLSFTTDPAEAVAGARHGRNPPTAHRRAWLLVVVRAQQKDRRSGTLGGKLQAAAGGQIHVARAHSDDNAGAGDPCVTVSPAGTCAGVYGCAGGGAGCQGPIAATETCNNQDDDCDGATDEDFLDAATGLYLSIDHCGSCARIARTVA